jgi:hypothetical protein
LRFFGLWPEDPPPTLVDVQSQWDCVSGKAGLAEVQNQIELCDQGVRVLISEIEPVRVGPLSLKEPSLVVPSQLLQLCGDSLASHGGLSAIWAVGADRLFQGLFPMRQPLLRGLLIQEVIRYAAAELPHHLQRA